MASVERNYPFEALAERSSALRGVYEIKNEIRFLNAISFLALLLKIVLKVVCQCSKQETVCPLPAANQPDRFCTGSRSIYIAVLLVWALLEILISVCTAFWYILSGETEPENAITLSTMAKRSNILLFNSV